MAISTNTMKTHLATEYKTRATYAAIYTSAPSSTEGGTEPTGGSPAYARKALSALWGTVTNGVVSATVTFDIPTGVTVTHAGVHSAISGTGNFLDGGALSASQNFASQGTYTLTLTYTQS